MHALGHFGLMAGPFLCYSYLHARICVLCITLYYIKVHRAIQSLTANKADSSALLQHQQHCQQQVHELQRSLAAAQSTAKEAAVAAAAAKRAAEPVEGLRLDLADTQGCMAALQAATAGV